MAAPALFRTLAFVPGNNGRFLEKARTLDADIVCLDLEDSVPHGEKEAARRMIADAASGWARGGAAPRSVFVRTNSPASGMMGDDLDGALAEGIDGIVVPKVDDAGQAAAAAAAAARAAAARGLPEPLVIPSIESAAGVVDCRAIASASPRTCAVVFGVFDLLNDMGVEYGRPPPPAAAHARARIALDSAAAGVPAIDAVWQDISDAEGLAADCREARGLGYAGKSIIHPSQIAVAHEAFAPTAAEVERARRTCAAYAESVGRGRGATVLAGDGSNSGGGSSSSREMIDEVHYKRAVALLEAAGEDAPPPPPAGTEQ